MHKDRVDKAHTAGTYHGTAWVSDESPPNANRYLGLRFQVTWAYTLWFAPVAQWELPKYNKSYPFTSEKRLLDIMNVPLKTGQCTLSVIDSQMARIGVYQIDYTAGVGDGGGENIGDGGVHGLIESSNPEYIRKRCLPHFAWRTFWAGYEAMGIHQKESKLLNAYLRRGITWTRLSTLSVKSVADGGLGLYEENTPAHWNVFGTSPPRLIDERPECTMLWMEWLVPRQQVLIPIIEKDLATRTLDSNNGEKGLATLKSVNDCIKGKSM